MWGEFCAKCFEIQNNPSHLHAPWQDSKKTQWGQGFSLTSFIWSFRTTILHNPSHLNVEDWIHRVSVLANFLNNLRWSGVWSLVKDCEGFGFQSFTSQTQSGLGTFDFVKCWRIVCANWNFLHKLLRQNWSHLFFPSGPDKNIYGRYELVRVKLLVNGMGKPVTLF